MSDNNGIYAFSHDTMIKALHEWETEQIKAFPKKKHLIQTTCIAMQYFMRSKNIQDNKMLVGGSVDNFIIEKPTSLEKWEV